MKENELDKFGDILIKRVRDTTITQWDKVLSGKMQDESSKKIYENILHLTDDQRDLFSNVISQVVDTTLHYLLWTIEEEANLNVSIVDEEGDMVELREVSDGLPGELYTEDGWILRFSEKRYVEPINEQKRIQKYPIEIKPS